MGESKISIINRYNGFAQDDLNHWTKQVKRGIVVKDKNGSLNFKIQGGACDASFLYIASIDDKKIKYTSKSGKLNEGDVLIELGGEGVAGSTLKDVAELITKLPNQVPFTSVPSDYMKSSLSVYLNERFPKNSSDHCLQQTIRRNIYKRALPCTTRPPREGEVDGVDYKFLTVEEFILLEKEGRLLEKGKYEGNYYGTLKPQNSSSQDSSVNHVIPWAGLPEHLYSMVKKSKSQASEVQPNSNLPRKSCSPPHITSNKTFQHSSTSCEKENSGELSPLLSSYTTASTFKPFTINIHNTSNNSSISDVKGNSLSSSYTKSSSSSPFSTSSITTVIHAQPPPSTHNGTRVTTFSNDSSRTPDESETNEPKTKLILKSFSPHEDENEEEKEDGKHNDGNTEHRKLEKTKNSNRHESVNQSIANDENTAQLSAQDQQAGTMSTQHNTAQEAIAMSQPINADQKLIETTLVKSSKGLGFTIIGVEDDESEGVWLVIKSVSVDGPAAVDDKLKKGDVLVSVNGREVCGLTHHDVVTMFKGINVGDPVSLEVVRGHYSSLNFDILEASQQKDCIEVVTTMAVGHENEEEVVKVVIMKGNAGFGFTLADRTGGQKVKQVVDVERCEGLKEDDLLVQVNSVSLETLSHSDVVDLLKGLPVGSPATFVVKRKAFGSNSDNNTNDNSVSSSTINLHNPIYPFTRTYCNKQQMQLPLQQCYNNLHTSQGNQSLQTPDFIPAIAFKDPHVLDVLSNTNNNVSHDNQSFNHLPHNPYFVASQNFNQTQHYNLFNNISLNSSINPLQNLVHVTLIKSLHGFGFRIIGGREEGSQVSVGLIVPGGPADQSGVMKLGQEILFIDQKCVIGAWHKDVVDLVLMASKAGKVQLGLNNRIYMDGFDHIKNNVLSNNFCYSPINDNNLIEVVLSRNNNEGFGFYILSSCNNNAPVIGEILEDSPASRCQGLRVGSEIVMINETSLNGLTHQQIIDLIKLSGNFIKLLVTSGNGCGGCSVCINNSVCIDSRMSSPCVIANHLQQQLLLQQRNMKSPVLMPSNSSSPVFSVYNQLQQDLIHQQQRGIQPQEGTEELYIELSRGPKGYGFGIRGGSDSNTAIVVCKMNESGVAKTDGSLQIGDELVSINGIMTCGMTQQEAINFIQSASEKLNLKVRRLTDVEAIEEL